MGAILQEQGKFVTETGERFTKAGRVKSQTTHPGRADRRLRGEGERGAGQKRGQDKNNARAEGVRE